MSLEIMFTSNTDPNPALKDKIDKVIKSWEEIGVVSKHSTFGAGRDTEIWTADIGKAKRPVSV